MRIVAATVVLGSLASCTKPVPPPAGPNVVRMLATEYAFGMPDTLPAGLTTFQLVNGGQEVHHAVLVRMTEEPRRLMAVMSRRQPAGPARRRLNQAARRFQQHHDHPRPVTMSCSSSPPRRRAARRRA
jgi:hypothetical protein